MTAPRYEFEYVTTSSNAYPTALQGSIYWFDSGTTESGEKVYHEASGAYAYWSDGVDWYITGIGDVGVPVATKFTQSGTTLTGGGGFSGTISISSATISDAWYRAETEAFESLRAFLGGTENDNCFRGFLPVMGDGASDKYKNVWQMTSGGSQAFDIDRLSGESGNWCSLRVDVRIESVWKSRSLAMKFVGSVEAWLKSTGNLGQTGNVTWCMMAGIPSEPEEYNTTGRNRGRIWRQNLELELVYKTESVYP